MDEAADSPQQFWTWRRVLLYAVLVALVGFLFYRQDLVVKVFNTLAHVGATLLLAVSLAYLLNPVVNRLVALRLPGSDPLRRTIWSLLVVLLFLGVVVGLAILTAAPLYREARDLGALLQDWVGNLPQYLDQWLRAYSQYVPPGLADLLETRASELAAALLQANWSFAKWMVVRGWYVVELLLIPVLAFHLLRDGRVIRRGLLQYLPVRHRAEGRQIADDIHRILKSWVRGILIVCLFFGVCVTLLLYFAGVPIYLTLGLLAGISWAIPIIGPVVSGVLIVGTTLLLAGGEAALVVLIIYVALNLIDSKLITPFVLGEATRLHPVTVIIALLVTGQLLGPLGMLFAVPLAAITKATYLRRLQAATQEETAA